MTEINVPQLDMDKTKPTGPEGLAAAVAAAETTKDVPQTFETIQTTAEALMTQTENRLSAAEVRLGDANLNVADLEALTQELNGIASTLESTSIDLGSEAMKLLLADMTKTADFQTALSSLEQKTELLAAIADLRESITERKAFLEMSEADRVAATVQESQETLQQLQEKLANGEELSQQEMLDLMSQVVATNAELVRQLVDRSTKSDADNASSESRKGIFSSIKEKAVSLKESAAERILPENSAQAYFLKRISRRFERTGMLFSKEDRMTEYHAVSKLFKAAGLKTIRNEATFRATVDKLMANKDSKTRVAEVITSPRELADLRTIFTYLADSPDVGLDKTQINTDLLVNELIPGEQLQKENAEALAVYSNESMAKREKIDTTALKTYLRRNKDFFAGILYGEAPAAEPVKPDATTNQRVDVAQQTNDGTQVGDQQEAGTKPEPKTESNEARTQIITEVKQLYTDTDPASEEDMEDFDKDEVARITQLITSYLQASDTDLAQKLLDINSDDDKEALARAISQLKAAANSEDYKDNPEIIALNALFM